MHGDAVLDVVAGIILKKNNILLCQRSENSRYPLQWEFPGGKIKKGENVNQAIKREIDEELSLEVIHSTLILQYRHYYHIEKIGVNLNFMQLKTKDYCFRNNQFHAVRFVPINEIITYDLLQADKICWPVLHTKIIHH